MLRGAVFWLGFGLMLPQAWWAKKTIPRFSGAKGEPQGWVGSHPPQSTDEAYFVVGLGDSIIAGVGAPTQDQTLLVQTTQALAGVLDRPMAWQAHGKIGADARAITQRAEQFDWPAKTDIVLISTGVNDLLSLISIKAWAQGLADLVKTVRAHAPEAWIVFCGLPPMHRFPSLPRPFRWVLGWRARHFDEVLNATIAPMHRVLSVAIDGEVGPELFSEDGFHPGPLGYVRFGQVIADRLAQEIQKA